MNGYTDTNPVITRIEQHYSMMSAQEKRVADYVMTHVEEIIHSSVAKIAQNAGVSPATVVRFSNSIGFDGVVEFKSYLRNGLLSPNGSWSSFAPDDSIERIATKTMDYNKRAIDETLIVLNHEATAEAVDAIEKAGRVVIFAEGASACSARCAYDAFLQIGIQASLVVDPFSQVSETALLTSDAVALGVCHSGRARNSVDSMRLAQQAGAHTISIVGIVGSPITKYSNNVLYTGLADNSFHSETVAVRICELNVVSVLHTALALRRQKQLGDYLSANSKRFELKRYKK